MSRLRLMHVPFAAALLFAALALPAVAQPPAEPRNGSVPPEAQADPLLARILQAFDRAQRDTS
ncbi:MAG: hypothetical protein AAB297_02740, partial [Acidobacteriota bacterium]